jgi:hypothetical protein
MSTAAMEVMGASIAMSITDCVTSTISQVVPALVSSMTVVGQASAGIGALTKDATDITHTVQGKGGIAPDTTPSKTVDNPNDPGYALALKDSSMLKQLGNLITNGPGNGVDWPNVMVRSLILSHEPYSIDY